MNTKHFESVYNLDIESIRQMLTEIGEPAYRAKQVWEGVYKHLWDQPDHFTSLPKTLRDKILGVFQFSTIKPTDRWFSNDGETEKTLFSLYDENLIETILMHYRDRNSLCISSQAGCALNCAFCATGQMGFTRDLSSGEIIEQVLWHARYLKKQDRQLTNIVLMGMGEPFLNYENVMAGINRLNNQDGFGFGERRFTISTAGIVPAIHRFANEKRQINLAVSLHAANDELRTSLMPINKKYSLTALRQACLEYTQITKRRITFEWALIEGVNDQLLDAQQLLHWTKNMLCHVNLIPLNPTSKYKKSAPSEQNLYQFKQVLDKAGLPNSIRLRRGIDIQAGCGQLAAQHRSNA